MSSIDSSSVSPFAKYSCSASPVKFVSGKTIIPGFANEVSWGSVKSSDGFKPDSELGINNGEYLPIGILNRNGSVLPSLE